MQGVKLNLIKSHGAHVLFRAYINTFSTLWNQWMPQLLVGKYRVLPGVNEIQWKHWKISMNETLFALSYIAPISVPYFSFILLCSYHYFFAFIIYFALIIDSQINTNLKITLNILLALWNLKKLNFFLFPLDKIRN